MKHITELPVLNPGLSRRRFVQGLAAGGVLLSLSPLARATGLYLDSVNGLGGLYGQEHLVA